MKLTIHQINQLYAFTRQHFVEWYDLQSELVDHLANAIEQEWKQNPNDSFDEILKKEFQKFGVFGFMTVVEERKKFLNKKYALLIWRYYKEFFSFPKIILTCSFIYGLTFLFNIFQSPIDVFIGMFLFLLVLSFGMSFLQKKKLKIKNDRSGYKFLFEEIAFFGSTKWLILSLVFQVILQILRSFDWHDWYTIVFSSVLVLIILFLYIQQTVIPIKVSESLTKSYPEYSL